MTDTFSRFTAEIGKDYTHVFSRNLNDDRPIMLMTHSGNGSASFHISVEHAEQLADALMDALDWLREAPARQYAAEQAETAACEQQERGSPERGEFDARTQMVPSFMTREAM
jgi:ribosomal protein S7